MTFQISVPTGSEPVQLELTVGQTLYILGANGTGKSNLMHRLYSQNNGNARWISAHRQTWFPTSMLQLSSSSRWDTARHLQESERQPQARWMDYAGESRPNIVLYDLIQKQNQLDREIAGAVRGGAIKQAENLARENDNPLDTLNELLAYSNLPISISVGDSEEILATRGDSQPYGIAEASDGERNVMLIAAEVLTVPPGTLILIDEPERHLHRSIISPLLTGLFSKRADCTFVISTHDVNLSLDNPTSRILLVRNCRYEGKNVLHWDADLVDADSTIGDELNKDILGSRRNVIFVEGETSSLDTPLYSLIFPNTSVIPKGSRKNVEDAVKSIRAAEHLHWIKAYGIVDNDGQDSDEVKQLMELGIYPIDAYSVESIYYDSRLQEEVAKRRTNLTGDDVSSRLEPAKVAALKAIKDNLDNLAERKAERKLREDVLRHLPNRKTSPLNQPIHFCLDAPTILEQERQTLQESIDSNALDAIIRQYPVRETPALARIATCLGFDNRKEYGKAVLQLLKDNEEVLKYVKDMLGTLTDHILSND